jgi:hypothetical protein
MRTLLVDPDLPPPLPDGRAGAGETRPLREIAGIDPGQELAWEPRRADAANLADLTYREFRLAGLGCGYSAFAGLVNTFAAQFGAPYDSFPFALMTGRRGRYSGAGKTCGALLGAGAAITIFWGRRAGEPLIKELRDWYAATPLPGYSPSAETLALTGGQGRDIPMPLSVAGSHLCTDSQANWVRARACAVQEPDKKERCGRLTVDVALKAMEILNRLAP